MTKNFGELRTGGFENTVKTETGLSMDQIPDLDPDFDANFCASEEGLLICRNEEWAVFRRVLDEGPSESRDQWYGKPEAFFRVSPTSLTDETLEKAEEYAKRIARKSR